jgi:hypothetical protein
MSRGLTGLISRQKGQYATIISHSPWHVHRLDTLHTQPTHIGWSQQSRWVAERTHVPQASVQNLLEHMWHASMPPVADVSVVTGMVIWNVLEEEESPRRMRALGIFIHNTQKLN